MRPETIDEMWAEYRLRMIPPDASDAQVAESRRCFYAGFYSAVQEFRRIGTDAVTEDQGVARMEALYRECVAFSVRVWRGEA